MCIQENYNDIQYIQQYSTIYDLTLHEGHNHMTLDEFLYDQSGNGTYATELFIKITAVIIGIDITSALHQAVPIQHHYSITE